MFAHGPNVSGRWHGLVEHLRGTAALARQFAGVFGAADAGWMCGICHDLGKASECWQRRLLYAVDVGGRVGVDHKSLGVEVVSGRLGIVGVLAIHGHHGGLSKPAAVSPQGGSWWDDLEERKQGAHLRENARAAVTPLMPDLFELSNNLVLWPLWMERSDRLSREMFTRMLFSCLVDADVLDTRAHALALESPEVRAEADLAGLYTRFTRRRTVAINQRGTSDAESGRDGLSATDCVREEVYEASVSAAEGFPGIYRLTAPTGAAKTMAAMGFALRHAAEHSKRRVVVAVPFTTITEQNAAVYRDLLDPGEGSSDEPVVLEHHSNAFAGQHPDPDQPGNGRAEGIQGKEPWTWLASENWDAPVVVTTTVQLFESVFGRRPGKVRKLHRLADSVIVLDEVQALPVALLPVIGDALRLLTQYYGATVLLSSATQPAVDTLTPLRGLEVTDVAEDSERWFGQLRRVRYEWWTDPKPSLAEVAKRAPERSESALVVVNTLAAARAMLSGLEEHSAAGSLVRHLSTAMCMAHRRQVLREVQEALAAGRPVLLAATQLIEAGVDVDFPVVYRAMAPADSILQAAGRANREGRLGPEGGLCVVFDPADSKGPLSYKAAVDLTRQIFGPERGDPDDVTLLRTYYEWLYRRQNIEGPKSTARAIQEARCRLDFPAVAELFRMIGDDTVPIVVLDAVPECQPQVEDLVGRLQADARRGMPIDRRLLRAVQPYVVNMRRDTRRRPDVDQRCKPLVGDMSVWIGTYSQQTGIEIDIEDEEFIL